MDGLLAAAQQIEGDAVPASGSAVQARDQVGAAIAAWETAAGTDLLGSGIVDAGAEVNLSSTDDQNVVTFDDLGSGGTIAVTYTWGIYGVTLELRGEDGYLFESFPVRFIVPALNGDSTEE